VNKPRVVQDPHRPHMVRVRRNVYGAVRWCMSTLGNPGVQDKLPWRVAGANFYFRHKSDAVAFRLVWADNEQED